MLKLKILIYFVLMLCIASFVKAAVVHGTVYDLYLKRLDNARVEINTSPKQFMIAQNGSYSFDVPEGFWTIKAQLMQKNSVVSFVQENISIKQDGSYVLDLILFPNIEEGIEDVDVDLNTSLIETEKNNYKAFVIISILLLIIISIFFYFYKKNMKESIVEKHEIKKLEEKQEKDEIEEMVEIIKQEGGRTTQKELRKQIPLSEAKVSLMIAELEHKGIIEKIKKGRGNIIILKKV